MPLVAHKPVLTVLIAAVLAIGGCLPCQKLFAGETNKKSCCNSKGECQKPGPDTPAKKACNLQQVADAQSEPQQQSDRLIDGGLPFTGEITTIISPVYDAGRTANTCTSDSSPPLLFLLNLSLLI